MMEPIRVNAGDAVVVPENDSAVEDGRIQDKGGRKEEGRTKDVRVKAAVHHNIDSRVFCCNSTWRLILVHGDRKTRHSVAAL